MLLPLPPLKTIINKLDLDFLYFDKLLEKLQKELFRGIIHLSSPTWNAYIGFWDRFVQAVVLEKDGICEYNKELFESLKEEIIILEGQKDFNFTKDRTISVYAPDKIMLPILQPYLLGKSKYGALEKNFDDIQKFYNDIIREKTTGCFSVQKKNKCGVY